jgi:pilus assembly protein CpaC
MVRFGWQSLGSRGIVSRLGAGGAGLMGTLKLRSALGVWLLVVIGASPLFAADAWAQQRELRVAVSSAQLVNFRAPARSVFIADPAIADVQVASPDSVIVFGRKPGQTTLIAIGENDKPLANMQVIVNHSYADLRRLILQDATVRRSR